MAADISGSWQTFGECYCPLPSYVLCKWLPDPTTDTKLLSHATFLSHPCLQVLCSICHLCPLPPWPGTLCSPSVTPPSQSSLWDGFPNAILSRHSFGHHIWWPPLWTSTPGCPTGASDSACPRGHPAFLLGSSVPTHGPSLRPVSTTSWSCSFPPVFQAPPCPSYLDSHSGLPTGPLFPTLSSLSCASPSACDLILMLIDSEWLCCTTIHAVVTQLYAFVKTHRTV